MHRLLIATRNRHKVGEIRAILGPAFALTSLTDLPGTPAVVEDADTFAGNARKKAEALATWLARHVEPPADWVLADDSGLEVDALNGAPGVRSARFAADERHSAGNSSDADNNAKLLRLLADAPAARRTARFRCAIALVPVTGGGRGASDAKFIFEGVCEGTLLPAPRGTAGFGYDPLFQPDGFGQTFAELGEATKNRISHRARALAQVRDWFETEKPG